MDDKSRSTYDSDFLVWSEEQAQALRELAKNHAQLPNSLDLENIIEEIETSGRSEFDAVESQILNIMIHLIKAASEPDAPSLPHWIVEMGAFHRAMIRKATPSMRARLDTADLWRRAHVYARADLGAFNRSVAATVPTECPFEVSDFLDDAWDARALLARLSPPA